MYSFTDGSGKEIFVSEAMFSFAIPTNHSTNNEEVFEGYTVYLTNKNYIYAYNTYEEMCEILGVEK